jgi:GT2 family glycosyltransferase
MRENFPSVKTIAFDKNHGFTGGYNRAFKALCGTGDTLTEDAPEYFLLINSDIEVSEGWLQPLVDWMDNNPKCGACAPKLHSWQERKKFEYAGAAGGYLDSFGFPFCRGRILSHLEEDKGQYDKPQDVFWATGACLMVRSEVYRRLGGLDERFFAHMEEIDLCWRMQLEGWSVTVVPQSVVYHVGGGTLPATSPFKLFLNFRNNLLMLENNLAKTHALKLYKQGMSAERAARKAYIMAAWKIFLRRDLDGCAAVVYFLTLRWDCLKAVLKADKEYKELKTRNNTEDICRYLQAYGTKAEVKGFYGRSIILAAVLKGRKVFESVKEKHFYNI